MGPARRVLAAFYNQKIRNTSAPARAALLRVYLGHVLDLDNNPDAENEYHLAADEFAKEFTDALKINPNDAAVYVGLGSARVYQHNLPDAVTNYSKAIALDPTNAAAHLGLGQALFSIALTTTDAAARKQHLLSACQALTAAAKQGLRDWDTAAIISNVNTQLARILPPGSCSIER